MKPKTCPCSAARTTPDPLCDMCDGWRNDPDTGWGGFTDHFLGKHFYSEEERREYVKNHSGFNMDEDDRDEMDD